MSVGEGVGRAGDSRSSWHELGMMDVGAREIRGVGFQTNESFPCGWQVDSCMMGCATT